jgi:Flp pilus assembly protein TadB
MWYERACKLGRFIPWAGKGETDEQFYDYISFTGLDVKPEEARAFAVGSTIITAALLTILTLFVFLSRGPWTWFLLALLIVPLGVLSYLGNYPKIYAEVYRVKVLGAMPEVISNMAMSLKLVPNLERAVEFAATNTRGQMGAEFRKMSWDTYMRVYKSSDDALAKFAFKWKKWNSDFARSIYLLKGSLLEKNESKRLDDIDRSVDVILDGTVDKMEKFARSLSMPTLSLYFMGMILPLIMIAVLPTLSYIGTNVSARTLFVAYNLVLPLIILVWSRSILAKRPVTTIPPEIPQEHPDVPPNGRLRLGNVIVPALPVALVLGLFISIPGIFRFYSLSTVPGAAASGTFLGLDPTILLIWGISVGTSVYLIGTTIERDRIRTKIKETEREFIDALIQLESRLSEGRPIEDAFSRVGRVMQGSLAGEIFANSAKGVKLARKTIHSSLFDNDEGALKHVYSSTIHNVMEMVVEASKKSNEAAGIAVGRITEHLVKIRGVDDKIENKLDEIVSSMRSTVLIFGPFVGGVVVSLQKMMNSQLLKAQTTTTFSSNLEGSPISLGEMSTPGFFGPLGSNITVEPISMGILQLIIGFYMLEMVVIFSLYMSELYVGDDKVYKRMEIGKNLMLATLLFTLAIVITQMFLGS